MRTTLKYGAAIGILASAFSTLGPVSAYAGQIPGGSSPITAVQQQAGNPDRLQGQQFTVQGQPFRLQGQPDKLQGQMAPKPNRYCHRWYNRHGHHVYCMHGYYY
jgi:hypothetical protein